jgi:hypothetical protein
MGNATSTWNEDFCASAIWRRKSKSRPKVGRQGEISRRTAGGQKLRRSCMLAELFSDLLLPLHHHQILLLLVELRESTKTFQALRSPAIPLASFHDLLVHIISSSIVLRHVLFGLPLLLYPWGFQSNAVFSTVPVSLRNVLPLHRTKFANHEINHLHNELVQLKYTNLVRTSQWTRVAITKTSRSTLCGETTAVCCETPCTEHILILLEKSEAF